MRWLSLSCAVAALAVAAAGPAQLDRALQLHKASQATLASGDYQQAIRQATEAASLFRGLGDSTREGEALNTIGRAHLYRGDYPAALRQFTDALRIAEMTRDGNAEVTRLNNAGNVHFFQGRYLDAQRFYERALERVSGATGEPWSLSRRQLTLTNLAVLYEQLGQNERALEYYREIRSWPQALPVNEHAQVLSNLGVLYRRMGDPIKAMETYRAAQQLFARQPHSAAEVNILHNIGIVFALDFQDLPSALASFTRALQIAEASSNGRQAVLERLFRGETFNRMDRAGEAGREFAAALAQAESLGLVEEHWTALYGLGRLQRQRGEAALALESFRRAIRDIESVRSNLGGGSLKAEFLANKRDVYDAAVAILLDQPRPPAAEVFQLVEQARARNYKDLLPAEAAHATLESVQAGLGENTLLLEYWLGSDRCAAVWVTRQAAGVVSRRFTKEDTVALERLISAVASRSGAGWRALAAGPSRQLLSGIDPLASPAVRQLVIVPDGILHFLPFEVLPASDGGPLVLERFDTSYAPSAPAALRHSKSASAWPRPPWTRQLVAFGDPIVPAASAAFPSDRTWARLPRSAEEVREIARRLPGASRLYVGPANRKQRVFDESTRTAPVLHFSTHAAIDLLDPRRSRMLFSPAADQPGSEYLFWREVQGLRWEGVELVTLAACETESGKLIRGEGVQSFSRAFLGAGAAATVTTLWRVADGPTADFMKEFYRNLARGLPKAQALRDAKLSFLGSGGELAHPSYWAAFVLNGDGRTPLSPFVSWTQLTLTAGVVLAVGAILWRRGIGKKASI